MKILGAGDNVADRYLDAAILYPGGNALNVAVFAARLGASAGYLGVLGDDQAGRHVLQTLQAEHVDTTLTRVAHGPNATADVELRGNDRVFLRSDRSTALFDLDDDGLAAMVDYDIVHSGYAGTLLEQVPEIAERSRVSFDFGSRFDAERVDSHLAHLFLATYSGSHLAEEDALALVERVLEAGAEHVLVTRGADGALFGTVNGIHRQAAEHTSVRDTLGAGDAFIAGMLVGLASGRDVRSTLVAASAQAAQVCQHDGAFGYGIPFDADAVRLENDNNDEKKAVRA
ncbi:MAG: PfkB family carbohydrate kinase [Microbacterium sp.]